MAATEDWGLITGALTAGLVGVQQIADKKQIPTTASWTPPGP